ncbi:unnamed protein product [Parnassius mnemosyne]|uniref:PiggyBac transposable element-derived protein domain-containing protein n=1 Tax=Parnassius mnemosyne TaxID=213953 RepID=A0AAV1KQY3_9NEOP
MTSRIRADDAEISRLLNETSDEEIQVSDSENEDNLLKDDLQTDTEDYDVSAQPVVNPLNAEDVSENDSEPSESASSSVPSYIIMPQRQILRGKTIIFGRPLKAEQVADIFITDDIVEEITKWTNAEIQLKIQRPDVKTTFKTTTCEEVRALFGILPLTAAMKDNHLTTDELFDCSYSGNRYVAAMSRDRFDFLIRCLRMDDKSLRPELRATDTFVPIRKIWEIFIIHCRSNYIPRPYATIDG